MSRPRIICHMHTMLNGKIDGNANPTSVGMRSQRQYYELFLGEHRFYRKHRGWLSGRETSLSILGGSPELDLREPSEPVPPGDFIADPDASMHYFAVDGAGTLPWDRNSFDYFDTEAHVVELLSGSASEAYKAHLRSIGVSYLLAGEERLDLPLAVQRIGEIYGVDELILGGGANLNWSMVREGLCDELSIVLMPTADAENGTNSLFEANAKYSSPMPYAFSLLHVEPLEDGSVWLRYGVDGPVER